MGENVKRCLERIALRNDDINAVLNVFGDTSPGLEGRLANLAVGVKANIAVRGQVWHAGIKAYSDQVATKDARVVSRLRQAGAAIIANLNMEEGALGAQTDNPWFGKTINPVKPGYTPGGSSGGSAAAVAAGFVDFALGTDTMGSVRIPSAYCGLWGYKPSFDADMLDGVLPLSSMLDTVGIHSKSFSELLAPSEIITGRSLTKGSSGDIARLDWNVHVQCEPEIEQAFQAFASDRNVIQSSSLGSYGYSKSRRAGLLISEVEGYEIHEHHLELDPQGFSGFFADMLKWGYEQPREKIDAAYAHVEQLRSENPADFILMPTAPQSAFKFGDPVPANQADFTAYANLANRPAICFPIGMNANGLPLSAQLVGPAGRDADLFATIRTLFAK